MMFFYGIFEACYVQRTEMRYPASNFRLIWLERYESENL